MSRLLGLGLYLLTSALLLYPESDWILQAWKESPIDRAGKYQFIAGLVWCALISLMARPLTMPRVDIKAIPFVVLSLLGYLSSTLMDIHSLSVFSALLTGYFAVWLLKGTRIAVMAAPGIMLSVLGAPTAVYHLDKIRVHLGIDVLSAGDIQLFATIVALALTPFLFWIAQRASSVGHKGVIVGYLLSGLVIVFGLGIGGQKLEMGPAYDLNLDTYTLGNWLGAEINVSPAEQQFFEGSVYTKHVYAKADGAAVALLNISTQDIHQLHAPEYCWTGAGWKVTERVALSASAKASVIPPAATLVRLKKQEESLSLIYWFNSGQYSTGDIADLRIQQQFSPGKEHKLYILSTVSTTLQNDQELLNEFLILAGKNSKADLNDI